jgi:hypothetical protein
MGTSRWDPAAWSAHVSATAGKPTSAIFRHGMHPDLDPGKIGRRESCDSHANPKSTPIIVAVDVTASMGVLAEILVREKLGVLVDAIYDRKPVTDPHLLLMAVGDAWCDAAPLQVTQFEADTTLARQLENFYIESGGGGNSYESYNLPWYFAATKTKCDAMIKRGKKGYLFTVGDEPPAPVLLAEHVRRFLGGGLQDDLPTRDLLSMVGREWEVFHLMVEEGSHYRSRGADVKAKWRDLLGERAVPLADHTKLSEVIVSVIQANEGVDAKTVADSWSGDTAMIVAKAVGSLTKSSTPLSSGVVRL